MTLTTTKSRWVQSQSDLSKYVGKRKHGSQMQQEEMSDLWGRLESFDNWNMSVHSLERIASKGIKATYDDIVSTIKNSTIIEYKIDYSASRNRCDERVVLRSNAVVNDKFNLNVVYSITRGAIVTVWINSIDDKHDTLDWSIYDENMKVFGAE